MTLNMYMKIPGLVGGATAPGYAGALDVLAFSWGAANASTAVGASGKAAIQDLSFTSYVDAATGALTGDLLKAAALEQAALYVVPIAAGPAPAAPDIYTMNGVVVTSISLAGSGGEDRFTVNYSFNFAALDFTIQGERVTWDLRTNAPIPGT